MKNKTAYIFISSTFGDMQAERDYLLTQVFPELREWCEQRGVFLKEIDLRWGITPEESKEISRAIDICLANIDKCFPYFLGLLGYRGGTVPRKDEVENAEGAFAGLREHAGHASVTQMEILHATVKNMGSENAPLAEDPLFLVRGSRALDSVPETERALYLEPDGSILAWQDWLERMRVRSQGKQVEVYECAWKDGSFTDFHIDGAPMKEAVIAHFKQAIGKRFPLEEEPPETKLVAEMQRTAALLCENYVADEALVRQAQEYIEGDAACPMIVCGKNGAGKTALLSYLAGLYESEMPRAFPYYATVAQANTFEGVLADLLGGVAGLNGKRWQYAGQSVAQMQTELAELAQGGTVLLLLDGLNAVGFGTKFLSFFDKLPPGLRVLIEIEENSVTSGFLDSMEWGGTVLRVRPIEDVKTREALVQAFLSGYLKKLEPHTLAALCAKEGAALPLFLKTAVADLRFHKQFDTLDHAIQSYGNTPGEITDAFFKRLLGLQLVSEDSARIVTDMLVCLGIARGGVSERELLSLLREAYPAHSEEELNRAVLSLLRLIRDFLLVREGRYSFAYAVMRVRVEKLVRYTGELHARLARVFFNQRPADCAYHTRGAGNHKTLHELYSSMEFLSRYYMDAGAYHLKAELAQTMANCAGADIRAFVTDTAAVLEAHPSLAPALLYKELEGAARKAEAARVAQRPWVRCDSVPLQLVGGDNGEGVVPQAVHSLSIRQGCAARQGGEAFLLSDGNVVHVINMRSLEEVAQFPLHPQDTVKKLFCDSLGKHVAAVLEDGRFYAYTLVRDGQGAFISMRQVYEGQCAKQRFGGICAFADGDTFMLQTPDGQIVTLSLESGELQTDTAPAGQGLLAGYFQRGQAYTVWREGADYTLRDENGHSFTLQVPVSALELLGGTLVLAPADDKLILLDAQTLEPIKEVPLQWAAISATWLGGEALLTDRHGALLTCTEAGDITDYGRVSVDNFDEYPAQVFALDGNSAFFWSWYRYTAVTRGAAAAADVLRCKENGDGVDALLLTQNEFSLLRRTGQRVPMPRQAWRGQYGAAHLTFKADWNEDGQAAYMNTASDVSLTGLWEGQETMPREVRLVLWMEEWNAFVLLDAAGNIRLTGSGVRSEWSVPPSMSGNYILCDCGSYLCAVSKNVLVPGGIKNDVRETRVGLFDKTGALVHGFAFSGFERPVDGAVYDEKRNRLYLLRESFLQTIDLMHGFGESRADCDFLGTNAALGCFASNGLLALTGGEGQLRVIDAETGTDMAELFTHRTLTSLAPSRVADGYIVENNEKIYRVEVVRA